MNMNTFVDDSSYVPVVLVLSNVSGYDFMQETFGLPINTDPDQAPGANDWGVDSPTTS
jgi:hypothetical protein